MKFVQARATDSPLPPAGLPSLETGTVACAPIARDRGARR